MICIFPGVFTSLVFLFVCLPYQVFAVCCIHINFGSCYCSSFEIKCVAGKKVQKAVLCVCVCVLLSYQVLSAHSTHIIRSIQTAQHECKKKDRQCKTSMD